MVNVAKLVKLPSGKAPKPMVWTIEREQRWRAEVDKHNKTYKRARDLTPPPQTVMVWRPDQLGAFLDHVQDHRLYALWWLLSHRGPTQGRGVRAGMAGLRDEGHAPVSDHRTSAHLR